MYLNAKNVLKNLWINPEFKHFGKPAQVGYDLTLLAVSKIGSGNHTLYVDRSVVDKRAYAPYPLYINPENKDQQLWLFDPGVYSLTFHQGCKLSSNVKAEIVHRSSLLRMGVEIKSAVYDPGFKTDKMGAVMIVHNLMQIEYGARVAQILMSETQECVEYDGQWQDKKDLK